MTAKEIAQQLKARVVYPTDPKRHIDLFRTNVKETWDRARAEALDFSGPSLRELKARKR